MIRNILAVVSGLFAGMGVNMVLVLVNGMVPFSMPEAHAHAHYIWYVFMKQLQGRVFSFQKPTL